MVRKMPISRFLALFDFSRHSSLRQNKQAKEYAADRISDTFRNSDTFRLQLQAKAKGDVKCARLPI